MLYGVIMIKMHKKLFILGLALNALCTIAPVWGSAPEVNKVQVQEGLPPAEKQSPWYIKPLIEKFNNLIGVNKETSNSSSFAVPVRIERQTIEDFAELIRLLESAAKSATKEAAEWLREAAEKVMQGTSYLRHISDIQERLVKLSHKVRSGDSKEAKEKVEKDSPSSSIQQELTDIQGDVEKLTKEFNARVPSKDGAGIKNDAIITQELTAFSTQIKDLVANFNSILSVSVDISPKNNFLEKFNQTINKCHSLISTFKNKSLGGVCGMLENLIDKIDNIADVKIERGIHRLKKEALNFVSDASGVTGKTYFSYLKQSMWYAASVGLAAYSTYYLMHNYQDATKAKIGTGVLLGSLVYPVADGIKSMHSWFTGKKK